MESKEIKPNRETKTIIVMMVLVLFAKLSGFYRDIVVASLLGVDGYEAQAFAFASLVPRQFLDVAFAAAISAGFIPVFNYYLEKKSKEEAFGLARNFITLVALVSLGVSLLGFVGAEIIAPMFFDADFSLQVINIGAGLFRIMTFTIFFTSTAFALTGLVQSLGSFYIPSIMSLVS
ncbi:MAG: hypothetical protein FWC69_02720, partial [Defluviitaleaceae bacterium]|nr:hypothetical protein [Defluviitaleaceae bacterium]